jgi:signal transduction histidine kinase
VSERAGRVLVIDDNPGNIELVEAQLHRAGFEVSSAAGGRQGLNSVAADPPDVILLDIMMPGMDGYEVLRTLKGQEATKSIPVIVLTALEGRTDKLRALELGANDFLTKPVDRAELLARVRTLAEFRELLRTQTELTRMKDELLSVVSHELRTPLASLVGFAELLLTQTYSDDKRREFLQVMHQEGRRLTALINDFLDLQRMESERQTVHPRPVALEPLLRRAANAAGHDPERPIILDVREDLPEVEADPDRLVQVMMNLLSNARKYSPGGGEIHVTAPSGERGLRVRVQDHGLGLPQDALPRLFQKFYRVDNSDRRSIGGTGLGLAICRQIIAEHGGRMGVNSDGPGKGSTFWFTLPLSSPNPTIGDVLIVEDDSGFGRLLEAELAALGLSAIRVSSGEAALDRLTSPLPRAMALDLLLPGISGEQLLEAIRQSGVVVPPVVVLSVKELEPYDRARLGRMGAVDFFVKGPQVASRAAASLADVVTETAMAHPDEAVPA